MYPWTELMLYHVFVPDVIAWCLETATKTLVWEPHLICNRIDSVDHGGKVVVFQQHLA